MADNEIHTDHPGVNPDPGVTRAPAGDATSSKDASQATQQTQHGARELASKAQAQARSMLDEQMQAAAGQVEGFAKALRKTSEQLDAQDQAAAARYVERTAEGLDSFSNTLRDQDLDSLTTQVQDYAKRQPAVFLGGAIAAGFLVARFLKSSAPSASLSTPSSSPSNKPYAGTATDEPFADAPRYSSPGSATDSNSTPI